MNPLDPCQANSAEYWGRMLKLRQLELLEKQEKSLTCPSCGNDEIDEKHADATFAVPETNWHQCCSCDYQWGHE